MTRPVSNPDTHHLAQQAVEGSGSVRADGNGWRDMASAPRDGTEIVAFIDYGDFSFQDHVQWFEHEKMSCFVGARTHVAYGIEATHWQDLPTPPALSEEKAS